MTSKISKTKQNISLILDKEFIQYCELNEIEDIDKLAKETFKRGFDLLKYGSVPSGEITSQGQEKRRSEPPPPPSPPPPRLIKEGGKPVPPPTQKIIEAKPLKGSDGREQFRKMGVVPKKTEEKGSLYDE